MTPSSIGSKTSQRRRRVGGPPGARVVVAVVAPSRPQRRRDPQRDRSPPRRPGRTAGREDPAGCRPGALARLLRFLHPAEPDDQGGVAGLGNSDRTLVPATISVLSGDVHHSYAARADFAETTGAAVYQLVCSPVHNAIPPYMKGVFRLGWSPRLAKIVRRWAGSRGAPQLPRHVAQRARPPCSATPSPP